MFNVRYGFQEFQGKDDVLVFVFFPYLLAQEKNTGSQVNIEKLALHFTPWIFLLGKHNLVAQFQKWANHFAIFFQDDLNQILELFAKLLKQFFTLTAIAVSDYRCPQPNHWSWYPTS